MARRTRSSDLEHRSNRLKLAPRGKPYSVMIGPRVHLCYRRLRTAGTWSVKCNGWLQKFAVADDFEDANGESVLEYWQALERRRSWRVPVKETATAMMRQFPWPRGSTPMRLI